MGGEAGSEALEVVTLVVDCGASSGGAFVGLADLRF
jgi:hypothetical protein